MTTILLVEDDPTIRLTTEFALTREGYSVSSVDNGIEACEAARSIRPDLILLDIMLPGLDGLEVAKRIRTEDRDTPILMLTALSRDEDKIKGLDAGADDYVTKPFSVDVLLARIRANLRRASSVGDEGGVLSFEDLELDIPNAVVSIKGKPVKLRNKESSLLFAMAKHPGSLCKREWLAHEVWHEDFLRTSRTIDVHIRRLRQALDETSDYNYIHTVHGLGYRFEPKKKADR